MFSYTERIFKVSIQDGIKLHYLQVKYSKENVLEGSYKFFTSVCSAADRMGCV